MKRNIHPVRGFALVIVLGVIVLLVILAVGFISSAGTERSAASGFRASVSTRQLADTAVGLIQGQINTASTQGSAVAWASQPGMVRTFDNVSGSLLNAYKLYSAPDMISSGVSLTADLPPATWATDTAIWTDLNAPVEVNGVKNFPILDPSAALAPQPPEGFSITSPPGATAYQSAPMPIRWLYMLSDGQVVAPSNTSGITATILGATPTNPIVGRIAFWADDDTCKVNINTASAGTYWDTPRVITKASGTTSPGDTFDVGYAEFPPAQKEFQRYAGHPATTSLLAVFPFLTKDQLYALAPRVKEGGSNGGTAIAPGALSPDTDRIYANVDELIFQPNRGLNAVALTKEQLEQAKFFLTARSRAPETNLFNLPRLAMWPIFKLGANGLTDAARTTIFDRLIAFCASTGVVGSASYNPYLFQREDAYSATNDIGLARNDQLLNYLTYLTSQPIPGFGGRFSTKYPLDRDQILTETFDYIRAVNLQDDTLPVPANRYTRPLPALGTLMNAPNGYGWVVPSKRGSTMGFGRAYTLSELSLVFICNAAPDDPITPTPDESKGSNIAVGAGANTVLAGTALVPGEKFIQAMILPELFSPMQGAIGMAPDMKMTISGLDMLRINNLPIFPLISGNTTFTNASGVFEISKMGGTPTYRFFGFGRGSPARGSLAGDAGTVYPFIGIPVKIAAPPTGGNMTFTGGNLTVRLYAGATSPTTAANLIQTFDISFPSSVFPVPEIVPGPVTGTNPSGPAYTDVAASWWAYSKAGAVAGIPGRLSLIGSRVFSPTGGYGPGTFLRSEYDTVRSILPPHGDYRLMAASQNVTNFVKHRYYDDVTRRLASSLSMGNASTRPATLPGNDLDGKYIPAATYHEDVKPDIPSDATGANLPNVTGDFDNGLANSIDGPYINKPDEGDVRTTAVNSTDFTTYPYFRLFTNDNNFAPVTPTFFSPNRQIPSSGMLGSLSTGIKADVPWKTLLFRPQTNHPSFSTTIPDHLLMDLFWMPVVEPYAISDRFSTAGKINLNYQILPFTYIERSTGVRAVLQSERLAAIPTTSGLTYKGGQKNNPATFTSFRLPINRTETLSQFQTKFNSGQIFKSASEICDIPIVPQGKTVADMTPTGFWADNALTGDNLRERIYTTLYPRLTTKSNTFTVHFRVQALKQLNTSVAGTWTEGKDIVQGEYRGSTTIERFIDANNPLIPNYAATPASIPTLDPLDKFYRWRIVENRQFAP